MGELDIGPEGDHLGPRATVAETSTVRAVTAGILKRGRGHRSIGPCLNNGSIPCLTNHRGVRRSCQYLPPLARGTSHGRCGSTAWPSLTTRLILPPRTWLVASGSCSEVEPSPGDQSSALVGVVAARRRTHAGKPVRGEPDQEFPRKGPARNQEFPSGTVTLSGLPPRGKSAIGGGQLWRCGTYDAHRGIPLRVIPSSFFIGRFGSVRNCRGGPEPIGPPPSRPFRTPAASIAGRRERWWG